MSNQKDIIKKAVGKVTLKDVGKNSGGLDSVKASYPENKKYYPSIYLSSDEAPFLEDCEVGDEETLVITIKIKSASERLSDDGSVKCDYTLDILKMGLPDK